MKAAKSFNDPDVTVEPLQVSVGATDDEVLKLANTLASPDSRFSLAQLLKERFKTAEQIPDSKQRLVTLDSHALSMINRRALDELYSKTHFELSVQGQQLNQNRQEKVLFMRQLRPYLSSRELSQVAEQLRKGKSIPVEKYLLPEFAKQNIRRYSAHRGPNCFHAALSFQSVAMSQARQVNVRRETGYHRDMINYDELWRVIQLEFYEVSLDKTDLQYGDMVLFFDTAGAPGNWVDFKSLRHATTYLFNGFVFSKGSKSANSPYTIRPISDEWAVWTKFTKEIGAKVFRKKSINDKKAPLWTHDEWMD